jgi:hypothetical protein
MGACGLVGEPSANHLRVAGLLAGRAGLALGLPAAQYAKATPPPPPPPPPPQHQPSGSFDTF